MDIGHQKSSFSNFFQGTFPVFQIFDFFSFCSIFVKHPKTHIDTHRQPWVFKKSKKLNKKKKNEKSETQEIFLEKIQKKLIFHVQCPAVVYIINKYYKTGPGRCPRNDFNLYIYYGWTLDIKNQVFLTFFREHFLCFRFLIFFVFVQFLSDTQRYT